MAAVVKENSWCNHCLVDSAVDNCFGNAFEAPDSCFGNNMELAKEAFTAAACTFEEAFREKADHVSNNWGFEIDSSSITDCNCSNSASAFPSSFHITKAWTPTPAFSDSSTLYSLLYQTKTDMARTSNFINGAAADLNYRASRWGCKLEMDENWSYEMDWPDHPVGASSADTSLVMEMNSSCSRNDLLCLISEGSFVILAACSVLYPNSHLSCCQFNHCCNNHRYGCLWCHIRIDSDSALEFAFLCFQLLSLMFGSLLELLWELSAPWVDQDSLYSFHLLHMKHLKLGFWISGGWNLLGLAPVLAQAIIAGNYHSENHLLLALRIEVMQHQLHRNNLELVWYSWFQSYMGLMICHLSIFWKAWTKAFLNLGLNLLASWTNGFPTRYGAHLSSYIQQIQHH